MRIVVYALACVVLVTSDVMAQESVQRSFWTQAGIDLRRQEPCDPFGQHGTQCASTVSPGISLEAGNSWWHFRVNGSHYYTPFRGTFGDASLRGRFLSIGPTRFGVVLAAEHRDWEHTVFTTPAIQLHTLRYAQSGFVGLETGLGDYHQRHVRLVMLAGHWMSIYSGSIEVPGFSGEQRLAYDEFSLGRMRLEASNIALGERIHLSGSVQHTWAYFTERRHSASPVVPTKEWTGTLGATVRAWSPTPRLHLDVALRAGFGTQQPSLTQDPTSSVGLVFRFQ